MGYNPVLNMGRILNFAAPDIYLVPGTTGKIGYTTDEGVYVENNLDGVLCWIVVYRTEMDWVLGPIVLYYGYYTLEFYGGPGRM